MKASSLPGAARSEAALANNTRKTHRAYVLGGGEGGMFEKNE